VLFGVGRGGDNRIALYRRYGSIEEVEHYQPTNQYMKKFEPGSFLKQRDYTRCDHLGLILSLGFGVIVFTIAFIVPLLS
jgi:hypothetical protein